MKIPSFNDCLKRQIQETIAKMKREGTTGASLDCLRANIRIGPLSVAHDAPRGTNAPFLYREAVEKLVNETPAFKDFILPA